MEAAREANIMSIRLKCGCTDIRWLFRAEITEFAGS